LDITDNTHTMISFKRRQGEYRVRMHHMFLAAPEPVVTALASYIRDLEPSASAELDGFIATHRAFIRRVTPEQLRRRVPIRAEGEVFDLQEVFDDINRRFFRGQVHATITWARVPVARRVRTSIKLGSYASESRLIRIHPALDQSWVPRFFVESVVFHEMLHHLSPATLRHGRRCVHTPDFLARERRFPHYQRALRWEREHLDLLLRYGVRECR
jgi:hypothetical protein